METNGILGEEQNDFRTNKRREDNMLVMREMIEMCNREGRKGC